MQKDILGIHCPSCGGAANFDIVNQVYHCSYCGSSVQLEDVIRVKKQLQEKITQHLEETAENFDLETTSCSGCGATLIFEENEALSNCTFCGRSLVRRKYAVSSDIAQSIVPFALTKDEAMQKLAEWCNQNKDKKEAQLISSKLSDLKGYYLPYHLVKGPVKCSVKKKGTINSFEANGYLTDEFINCSEQLDNQLLDAMEPYDLSDLKEFDFAYVAGQRVKVSDISKEEITRRLQVETSENYKPTMEKMWGTKSIEISSTVQPAIELPVLLPVYYISDSSVSVAVNGQTGKVSVRAQKESKYVELPWWLKGLGVLLFALGATFLGFYLGNGDVTSSLISTGFLAIFYAIVFACMFEGADNNLGTITRFREIYSSGDNVFRREKGKLVPRDEVLKRKIAEPVFLYTTTDKQIPVSYSFRSLKRVLSMVLLSAVVTFLPIITAVILNGFNFSAISIGGSAVWLCIAVPVVPIYFILFGIKSLYDTPWIYTYTDKGKKKRYKGEKGDRIQKIKTVLKYLCAPGARVAVIIVIIVFCIMVYLTGFDTL